MTDASIDLAPKVRNFFQPRRFGHANLFVSDYAAAQKFYQEIAGIHEVYRQPDNMASFISNGNTYHDFGLTDVRSPYAAPAQRPGLYHIALELENEIELVDGYNRAIQAGVIFSHTRDHDVAHSCYLRDPDGNMVEIYADVTNDWQTSRRGIIIKKKPPYVPGVTSRPVAEKNYPVDPELTFVEGAVFRARKSSHVAFVTQKLPDMFRFYVDIVGLSLLAGNPDAHFVVLRGTYGKADVTLLSAAAGLTPGLHHVGIEVDSETNLDAALRALPQRGVNIARHVAHVARRAIMIPDSSGILLQFYANRDWRSETVGNVRSDEAPWLL